MTNEEKKVILTAIRRQLRNVALLSTALCKKDCNDCVFDMSHVFDPKCGFSLIDACIENVDECFRRIENKDEVSEISSEQAIAFLLPRHYSGRKPNVSIAFGWFSDNDELKSVCTFGKPASPYLCYGVCGKEWSANVYELNRLCRTEDLHEQLSEFVGQCLRELKKKNWIIVSYSDTQMHHNGYIYQACNFIYTGCTRQRTDMYTVTGKHSRHYKHEEQSGLRKVRSSKHRYIYFCTSDKKLKRQWMKDLKYPICPYPKGVNENYVLGEYIKDVLVPDNRIIKENVNG